MADLRSDHEVHLDAIATNGRRLVEVARGHETLPVPSCPEWTVRELVAHLATVYRHKIELTQRRHEPDPWPPDPPEDVIGWLEGAAADLVALFAALGPDAPSTTWPGVPQTVAVWCRRMALESAVHRRDAEQACGEVTPIPAALAADGVDELLRVLLGGDWSDDPQEGASWVLRLNCPKRSWLVSLTPAEVAIDPAAAGRPQAVVTADVEPMLLWLWGRLGNDAVSLEGDPAGVEGLQSWLRLVT